MRHHVFNWAESRNITISAIHVKGVQNVEADKESRLRNMDSEWMLRPEIFKILSRTYFTPDIDLFASRIN